MDEISSIPSSLNTLATAPSSMSVFRVRKFNSSLASRQSGRMLEKICLCLTWPAITAWLIPSLRKVSVNRDSSPRESQYTRIPGSAAARASISGSVSSLMAATTTSAPCARAASSSRNGKRPLPAIRPSLVISSGFILPLLLDHAPVGTLDKGHQVSHAVFRLTFASQAFQGLGGVELGCQQDPVGVLQGAQLLLAEARALEADPVQAI